MPIVNSFSNASARGLGFTAGGKKLVLLSASPAPSATVTTYSGYIVFKFTSSGTLNVGAGTPAPADVLLVRGGTSGGSSNVSGGLVYSGAGGSGGKFYSVPATTITANSPIPVVVGGTATDSTFGPLSSSAGSAASGGAGRGPYPSGSPPISAPGFPGTGGSTSVFETGSPVAYGGGGGGGAFAWYSSAGPGGTGGAGGGGNGGPATAAGSPGTINTGGGGGGAGGSNAGAYSGGTGGSGVVVARFPDTFFTT